MNWGEQILSRYNIQVSPMAALQVITETTYDASSDDKVDIMAMITL